VIPNVKITLRNMGSGVTSLPPPTPKAVIIFYSSLQRSTRCVPKARDCSIEVTNVVLTIGQQVTQDFALKPGSVDQTVTVSATAAMVDVKTPEVSGVITQNSDRIAPH